MPKTLQLLDPGGTCRAHVSGSAGTEALVRVAWNLADADSLVVVADGQDAWLLCIHRAGHVPCLQSLDITCGHVPDPLIEPNKSSMIEAGWLALVDDGWTVQGVDHPSTF